jgi:hypothetical protein
MVYINHHLVRTFTNPFNIYNYGGFFIHMVQKKEEAPFKLLQLFHNNTPNDK